MESTKKKCENKVYKKLKSGMLEVKVSSDTFVCPFCPKRKKRICLYLDLLQHASGVGNSNSKKRSEKEKAIHRALATYLQKDLADSTSPSKPLESSEHEEKLVWPWKGIVVNIPTTPTQDGRLAGESGSILRDEFTQRGFSPMRVCTLWDDYGHTGTAIVEFNNYWNGLHHALLFEKAYQTNAHGKKDWLSEGEKSGLYAWLARADDYNWDNIVGENLRKMGDLRTISELMEEETWKEQKLVQNLTKIAKSKEKSKKAMEKKLSKTKTNLKYVMEEKEKLLQEFSEDLRRRQHSAMVHFNRMFGNHEKEKMQLESQRKELEIKGLELAMREANNEIERKKLAVELEENAIKNCFELADMEQEKAGVEVRKLAEYQKRQKEELHERVIALERQLDHKQALELEVEQLRGQLNVIKHMEFDGDAEIVKKVETLLRDLSEKEREFEDLNKFHQDLIVRERKSNDELQEARKELISNLKDIRSHISVKRMGELDTRPFLEALKRKHSAEDAEYRTVEVCQLWEEYLKDPDWHPFKRIKLDSSGDKEVEVINEDEERLRDLKNELGDDAYNAVAKALLEINDCNPSGRYITSELWNFRENRKGTLQEGVICLLEQWNKAKRQRAMA